MDARNTGHPSHKSCDLTVKVGMYEMGVDDVRRPPLDLLEQTPEQQRVRIVPGREARRLDAVLTHSVHEPFERTGPEHQHLCLDAALHQRRQQLEEMALRACDAGGSFWTWRTRILGVFHAAAGIPTVTLARPSRPGRDRAPDRSTGIEHLSDKDKPGHSQRKFHESATHNHGS